VFLRDKAGPANDEALPADRPPLGISSYKYYFVCQYINSIFVAFLIPPIVITLSNILPVDGPASDLLPDDSSFDLVELAGAPWVTNVDNFARKITPNFKYSSVECDKHVDGSFNCHKLGMPRYLH
jgi:hypothetical protein